MSIDDYHHSFKYLEEIEFPPLINILLKDASERRGMKQFSIKGDGVKKLSKVFHLDDDFSGCYLLLDKCKPVYVGISRSVLSRLRQHVRGTTSSDASLAYRIARKRGDHGLDPKITRKKAMGNERFKRCFNKEKEYLKTLNVAFVRIDNPLVLYVFEPYCATYFDTREWNTFETH